MFPEALWTIGAVSLAVGMYWFAYRMEPHWVSKDGSRFLTTAQSLDRFGTALGRKVEVRASFLDNGHLLVSRRMLARSDSGVWRISAKSLDPPRGRAVYLLERVPPSDLGEMLMLRLPESSKAVPALDDAKDRSTTGSAPGLDGAGDS